METRKYGLFTAIAMIVGIVIGSGIFFKSYGVLKATGGSIAQGVIAFLVAAISIVFGSLAISELASRTDNAGGVISYSDKFWGKKLSIAYGWFHTFIYYPSLVAVVSWVAGIYLDMLFGIEDTLEHQIVWALAVILVLYGINFVSAKWGGAFQNASTIIKLIPLILFGVIGLIFGDISAAWGTHETAANIAGGASWIGALPAVLFSFDGWIIATTICHEIKDSKKNLYLALTISPLIIMVLYVVYFVGMCTYLGPDTILTLGSSHLQVAAQQLLGTPFAAKLIIVFVIISVMGTSNGLILGFIRLPYSLSLRKMFPNSEAYTTVNPVHGIPLRSGVTSLYISLIWLLIHYITQKFNVFPNSDVSEIAIIVNYLLFITLYAAVFKLHKQGEVKGFLKGILIPVLATIGSLICVWSGFQNKYFLIYLAFSLAMVIVALIFLKTHPAINEINEDDIREE